MVFHFEHNEELYSIDAPVHVWERSFESYCDFQNEERKYIALSRPPDLKEDNSNKDEVDSWELPVEDCIKQLVISIEQMITGDVRVLPFTIKGEVIKTDPAFPGNVGLMDRKYRIKAGDELSILRLYVHILTIIREFKPTKIPRSYVLSKDGKTFVIGAKAAAEMLLGKSGGSVATGEALEILEYQRRYALALKNKPLEVGNLDFTLGLTEFAILVRQNGERLPWEKGDLDRFIQERREFFKDLPLDEVLSIRFFLLNALLMYKKNQTTGSFGNLGRRRRKRKGRSITRPKN